MFSHKQKMFIEEYLLDLNAGQAAARAGYSAKSARYAGRDLMKNPDVKAAIAARMAERAKRVGVTQEMVLTAIGQIAFNDLRAAYAPEGVLLPVQAWPPDLAATVASIKIRETQTALSQVIHKKSADLICILLPQSQFFA